MKGKGRFIAETIELLICCIFLTGCVGRMEEKRERPEISFMCVAVGDSVLKNDGSDIVVERYEEYTGITVEWQWIDGEMYNEKLRYVLMDKTNIPMVVTVGGNLGGEIVKEAKKGSFWDLTPYLENEELFPNLSKANKNVLKGLSVDGEIIGIYRSREVGRYGLSYRKDWAEAVGITKTPESVQDIYEMLYAFTYEDPDGNGIDDTCGLELTEYMGTFDIIQTWFGCGNKWVEAGGRLLPVHETDEYMEALNWLRKIYEEGLVRKDWPLTDSGCFGEGVKTGEAGVIVDVAGHGTRAWKYFQDEQIPSASNPAQTASMELVGPVEGKTLATSGYNGFFVITRDGAKTEADVINCLTFLDKMCDDEMMVLAEYGLENVSFTYDSQGKMVKNSDMEEKNTPQYGLSQAIPYIPNWLIDKERIPQTEITMAQDEVYARNVQAAVYNPAIGYLACSEVNADKGAELEKILEKARTAYICCQITEAELQNAFREWEQKGGLELVEEINRLYAQDK